ncbi:MAG: hypothetical protein AAF555_04835 [Verrucomicrobiota bacterium]
MNVATSSKDKLGSLRAALCDRFGAQAVVKFAAPLTATEAPVFPRGEVTELVAEGPGSGIALVVADLLRRGEEVGISPEVPLALIDGTDSFDPESYGAASCDRVLWVRCREVGETLRAADLLLRDGNLPLVVLDIAGNDREALRGVAASSWHRLRILAQTSGVALVVLSSEAVVAGARQRRVLPDCFTLEDLDRFPGELHAQVRVGERGKEVAR